MPTDKPFYLIGHRGAAGERLENSMEGFVHALTLPIDAVEIDIREHNSNLWVFHDDVLGRVTDHGGSFHDQPDLTEVRLNNGEPIPTLSELLDLYWGKMPLNIEIKSISNMALLSDLLDEYPEPGDAPGLPWIFISSFEHDYLHELKRMNCPWPLAPLNERSPGNSDVLIQQLQPGSWHLDDDHVDFALVQKLRDNDVISLVYTVNDAERAAVLRENGVAGIFTDEPSKLLQQL